LPTIPTAVFKIIPPKKSEIELFDLRIDPHGVNNVANGPKYSKLNAWRSNVILDQGVSDDFRARDIFPKKRK
jgi:N-sulfoglucosamine sulfohydrolase